MSTVEQALPVSDAPPMAALKAGRRIGAFDGMRAVAVVLVMFGHANFGNAGFATGVDVFFVLSGYLITAILLDELGKRGKIEFKNFYMRRVLRLFPALFLLIVLFLVMSAILKKNMGRALGDAGVSLIYISNWTKAFGDRPKYLAHTWSLSIEEQFYLLWPVMVFGLWWMFGRTRKAALLCLYAAVWISFYRQIMEMRVGPGATEHATMRNFLRIYFGTDTRGDTLLAGAALAFWTPKIPRAVAVLAGWLGVFAMAWFLVYPELLVQTAKGTMECNLYAGHWTVSVPAFLWGVDKHPYGFAWGCTLLILLGILNYREGLLPWVLSLKPLAWIGVISYGLYLFHFPIMLQLGEWKWNRWYVLMVGASIAFSVATVSFYALERPCLRLKSRFRSVKA